jgi:hypothetical protein
VTIASEDACIGGSLLSSGTSANPSLASPIDHRSTGFDDRRFSDPSGAQAPGSKDIHDPQRLNRALILLNIDLMDYLIAGESITS